MSTPTTTPPTPEALLRLLGVWDLLTEGERAALGELELTYRVNESERPIVSLSTRELAHHRTDGSVGHLYRKSVAGFLFSQKKGWVRV